MTLWSPPIQRSTRQSFRVNVFRNPRQVGQLTQHLHPRQAAILNCCPLTSKLQITFHQQHVEGQCHTQKLVRRAASSRSALLCADGAVHSATAP